MHVRTRSLLTARWFWPLVLAVAVLAALVGAQVAQAAPAHQTGTRPVDCPSACKARVEAWMVRCREAGGTDCEAEAKKLYADCLASCDPSAEPPSRPDPRPAPDPADCKSRCQSRVDAWRERCEAGGTAAEDCSAKATRLLAECLSSCERQVKPAPAPRPSDCESGCKERAKAWMERCKAAGGSTIGAVDCSAGARKIYAECLASCEPRRDPAPPTDCASRCKERVMAWMERCKAGGGSDCDAEGRKLYAECVASCEPKSEPPADCASACKARVVAWMERCKAGGGTDCDAEGRRLYAECVANCPSTRPAPGPREPRP